MALTKVSGGILDPGINVAGIVTATGFDGPFIGGSSKNIVAGIITATELDISGNIDVDGHTELDQLNVSGVSTFVGNIGGTPTFTGDVTFNGNVSIAQTLTYSDVTNIDSVGIVTAREGVFLPDNKKLELGNVAGSGDLQLYHNASNSILKNNTGDLELRSNVLKILGTTGAEASVFTRTGSVDLMFNGVKKFETTNTGVTISGANATGSVIKGSLSLQNEGGTQNIVHLPATGKLRFADNKKATFGNSDDLEIYHSTNNIIQSNGLLLISSDNTNNVKIMTKNQGQNSARFIPDGAAELYHSGSKKFETNSIGVDITGTCTDDGARHDGDVYFIGGTSGRNAVWDMSDNALEFADNAIAKFGSSDDLEIFHDGGTLSYIRNNTGKLVLRSDTFQFGTQDGTHRYIDIPTDEQGVSLFYDNNAKLETKGYGIDITGGFITTGGSIVQDGGNIKFGTGSDLQIFHDNSNNINVIQCHNGRTLHIDKDNGAENMAKFIPDGAVELYHNNVKKIETTTDGVTVTGAVRATGVNFTVGSTHLTFGHGGSFGELDNLTGNLRIKSGSINLANRYGNHNFIYCNASNSVDLYYDAANHSTPKLKTSATGITVDGEVAATQDYPNIRPVLDFNFAAEKKLDPRITFYRTTIGSYIDENGDYRWASANQPKFNHDEVTHESKGLLIEPARTNLITSGNNIPSGGNSGGTPGPSLVANDVEAPDGSFTARTIDYSNASSNMNSANIEFSWDNTPAGKTYSASIWVKGTQGHTINMYLDASGQGSGNLNEAKITRTLTGKWQRMSVYYTYPSGANAAFLRVGTRSLHSLSQGTATVVSFWGTTVVEESQPGSTIATPIVSVTTAPDYALVDGEDFTEFFNQVEGTIITSTDTLDPAGVRRPAVIEGDVTNNDRHYIQEAGAYQYQIKDGGTTVAQIDAGAVSIPKNIIAAAYKLNDAAVTINGSDPVTDTSATMPTCTKLKLGEWSGTFYFGHISRFMYYRNRIPNSQLKTLSSQ